MHAVLSTYVEVYRMLFRQRALLVRFGVVMCVAVAGFWALCTYLIGWTAPALPVDPQPWIYFCLGLWFFALLAVRWHRLVLLDEGQVALLDIRPGRREIWFLVRFVLIGLAVTVFFYLIVSILMLAGAMMANTTAGHYLLDALTASVETPVTIPLIATAALQTLAFSFGLARLGLILPAAAVDRPLSVRESWQATTGRGMPFFALIILVDLPIFVVESLLNVVDIPEIVSLPLFMAVWWVTIAATATALSFNYATVVGRPGGPATSS